MTALTNRTHTKIPARRDHVPASLPQPNGNRAAVDGIATGIGRDRKAIGRRRFDKRKAIGIATPTKIEIATAIGMTATTIIEKAAAKGTMRITATTGIIGTIAMKKAIRRNADHAAATTMTIMIAIPVPTTKAIAMTKPKMKKMPVIVVIHRARPGESKPGAKGAEAKAAAVAPVAVAAAVVVAVAGAEGVEAVEADAVVEVAAAVPAVDAHNADVVVSPIDARAVAPIFKIC